MIRRVSASAALLLTLLACKNSNPGATSNEGGLPSASSSSGASGAATPMATASQPAHAIPVPSASIAAAVNPRGLPPYAGPIGSVEGTISIRGPRSPAVEANFAKCPEGEATYKNLFRDGKELADGARALPDAIVAVTGYSGFYIPESKEGVRITYERCAFPKRALTMTFGQQLEVMNRGTKIFAPAFTNASSPALMIAPPNGEAVKLYPPHPGYYTLVDRLVTDGPSLMDVYVFLHPLHAVADLDGKYRIDGVPVGEMTVNARLGIIGTEASKKVAIEAGKTAHVDLTLTFSIADGGAQKADTGAPPIIK